MMIIQDEMWSLKLHVSKGAEESLFQDHQLQLLFINHKLCVNYFKPILRLWHLHSGLYHQFVVINSLIH